MALQGDAFKALKYAIRKIEKLKEIKDFKSPISDVISCIEYMYCHLSPPAREAFIIIMNEMYSSVGDEIFEDFQDFIAHRYNYYSEQNEKN